MANFNNSFTVDFRNKQQMKI